MAPSNGRTSIRLPDEKVRFDTALSFSSSDERRDCLRGNTFRLFFADTHTQAILTSKRHEDELLWHEIHRLRHLWDRAASSYGGSALDDYVEAVLSLYREFKAEDIAPEKSQRMLKLAKVHNWRKMGGSIERIIQATSDAPETIARRMTLALRYGQRQKWPDIKQGLRENGGIVGCAEKFAALED